MRERILERLPLPVGLALVALAIGLGSVFIADGIRDRNRSDVITVTGSAKRRIVSDYVIWEVSVSSQQPTVAEAARELAGWSDRTRTFLRDKGARDEEVTARPISTETLTDQAGKTDQAEKVTGFRLTRSFQVRSARVDAISQLAENSSELVAQGIPIVAQPIQYVYTKLPSLRPQLLQEAIKDALRRADVVVKATGARLGKLRGVNVGVFQVTTPNSTEVSDYGVYDTSTLEKDVTAVVSVTFAVR